MDERKRRALDELFGLAEKYLEKAHEFAYDNLDAVVKAADEYLANLKTEVERRLVDKEAEGKGEPVRVEPSRAVKENDIRRVRAKHNLPSFLFGVTETHINDMWATLPEEEKSWASRDDNSPL